MRVCRKEFKIFVPFYFLVFFISCVKKEVPPQDPVKYDTLKPLAYFPVYPGSSWEYKQSGSTVSTQTVTCSTNEHYELQTYSVNFKTTQVYVPYLNENGLMLQRGHIFEYKHRPRKDYTVYWEVNMNPVEFLSEKPGPCHIRPEFKWYDLRSGHNIGMEETYLNIEKKKVGLDSVLIVSGRYLNTGEFNVYYSHANQITHTEYTKWKGITLRWVLDTLTHDTLFKAELLNYHINK